LLVVLVAAPFLTGATVNTGAPDYSAATILNSYAGVAGMYSPGGFVSILGTNLSSVSRVILADDLRAGIWPDTLPSTGVRVLVNNIPANISLVSPTQVDLMIPLSLIAGPATLVLVNNGLAGPSVQLALDDTDPIMLHVGGGIILAAHLDWTRVTPASPAHRGELVVIYAVGLGPTLPAQIHGSLPDRAASITKLANFQLWLNGTPVDSHQIAYAGISPPYPEIFQINLFIPIDAPIDPEIRLGFPGRMSLPGGTLPLQ